MWKFCQPSQGPGQSKVKVCGPEWLFKLGTCVNSSHERKPSLSRSNLLKAIATLSTGIISTCLTEPSFWTDEKNKHGNNVRYETSFIEAWWFRSRREAATKETPVGQGWRWRSAQIYAWLFVFESISSLQFSLRFVDFYIEQLIEMLLIINL